MHLMLKNYFRLEIHSSSSKTQSESVEPVACDCNTTQPWQRVEQWGREKSTSHLETVSVCKALVFWSFWGGARAHFPNSGWLSRLQTRKINRVEPGLQSLISSPDAKIVVHLAPCWKLFVHKPYKMLAVLSISMRSLFMQEFSPYICMLVRFNVTKLENFKTMFLEGQPGQYH